MVGRVSPTAWSSGGSFGGVAPPATALDNVGQIYREESIEGTADGNTNFCDTFPESAYTSAYFNNIWYFYITYLSGERQSVYCLEKGLPGPNGNAYASRPPEVALPDATQDQLDRMAWILANSYPAIAAEALFQNAGVDAQLSPPLLESDAYAATQVALWSLFNMPPDTQLGWSFLGCVSRIAHPKSARLRDVVAYLMDGAQAALESEAPPPAPGCGGQGCRSVTLGNAVLQDCGSSELSRACGKLLYGPLRVLSPEPFVLDLSAVCESVCQSGFVTLSDACGTPIAAPVSGQEFFVALPGDIGPACYRLSLGIRRKRVTVALMVDLNEPPHPARKQTIGAVPKTVDFMESASLCFCVAPPCKKCEALCPCMSSCAPACKQCPPVPAAPPPCVPPALPPCPPPSQPHRPKPGRRLLPGQRPYYPPR